MGDSNVVKCPFDPSEENLSQKNFAWTLFERLRQPSTSVAIVDAFTGQELTYQELHEKSETLARHLLRLGCATGDVVGIFSPNSIEWLIVMSAALRVGAVIAGIDCLSRAGELRDLVAKCKATVLYTIPELATVVLQATENTSVKVIVKGGFRNCIVLESLFSITHQLPELPTFERLTVKADDPALIMFSSGTTGTPKAILLTHYNLHAICALMSHPQMDAIHPKEVICAPLSHAGGFIWVVGSLTLGYTTLLLPRFDLRVYLKCIQDHKLEKVFAVPPVATLLAKSPVVDDYQLGHLKAVLCGAAPLSSNVEDLLMERFPGLCVRQSYGLTETFGPCCGIPSLDKKTGRKPGSIGVPMINVQMKVVDTETRASLGSSQIGEICIRGATNSPGYKDDPVATAALIDKDGWIHSGDIGYYDEDGYFFIVDRLKELIKYNAYQVSPAELEGLLMSHPQVLDAGVFAIPDLQAGELPSAWVVLRSGSKVTELELLQFVADAVSPYKKLRGGIRFVSSIPKSANGKILRRQMREENTRGKL